MISPSTVYSRIGHQLESNCRTEQFNGSGTDGRNKLYMWREAYGMKDAAFSYRLAVESNALNYLCVAYWGGDFLHFKREDVRYERQFSILVEDVVVGEQRIHMNKIGEVFYVTYDIPEEITRDKESVRVTFQATGENGCAGKVTEVRTTRSRPESLV